MERIIITEFGVPSLVVGRTTEELLQNAVVFASDAAFLTSGPQQELYPLRWAGAIDALERPTTITDLDAWLMSLHEAAKTAFCQPLPPLRVVTLDAWEGDPVGDDRLAACCAYLWTNVHADAIVRQLQKPLDITDDLTASAQRILCVEGTGLSRPAAVAGAAVLRAAKRITTRVRLADVASALEHLAIETGDEIYKTSRQAIQDRLRVWSFNEGLTDDPTAYEILTADQREEE